MRHQQTDKNEVEGPGPRTTNHHPDESWGSNRIRTKTPLLGACNGGAGALSNQQLIIDPLCYFLNFQKKWCSTGVVGGIFIIIDHMIHIENSSSAWLPLDAAFRVRASPIEISLEIPQTLVILLYQIKHYSVAYHPYRLSFARHPDGT